MGNLSSESMWHYLGISAGAVFIVFFSYINIYVWGAGGGPIHLLGAPVDPYEAIGYWIAMIFGIYAANYAVNGHPRGSICHVIAAWWTVNIGMTQLLNDIKPRGIEQSGGVVDLPTALVDSLNWIGVEASAAVYALTLDFVGQGFVDVASVIILAFLVLKFRIIEASIWTLFFTGFLIANIIGHTTGAYGLMTGQSPDITAQLYEPYMFLVFTVMLVLQLIGSSGDVMLKWIGSDVDLYADIRIFIRGAFNRNLHLH